MAKERLCLVVVSSEEETRAALYYADVLARRIDGVVGLFGVAQAPQAMVWLVVENTSVEETRNEMHRHMKVLAKTLTKNGGKAPRMYVRDGVLEECLSEFVEEHQPVALIMGTMPGHQKAGELIAAMSKHTEKPLTTPMIIVSPLMTQQEIDLLA